MKLATGVCVTNLFILHCHWGQRDLVLISPIFYEQLFHMKVVCAAFMCLQIEFAIFWRKAAHKMLVKLTHGVYL
jgi:hypothetical protein